MIEPIGCETKRREKHIEIHDAIQQMDSITRQLDELIYRIEGPVPQVPQDNPNGEYVKEPLPPLIEVLSGGAGEIREKTANAHKRIVRLNELLF